MNFKEFPIIPVIKINDAKKAAPLAKTLYSCGIKAVEITLRTEAGISAIKNIRENAPEIKIGAGSVLDPESAKEAVGAGADFIVSPGFGAGILKFCNENGIPYIPGCATATEVQTAAGYGCKLVKFFPAGALGGAKTLASLAAPFPQMKFMPTGGVNENNAADYLKMGCVCCVGASSIAPETLIDSGDFEKIAQNARRFLSAVSAERDVFRNGVKNGKKEIVALGEIMLRLSPPGRLRFSQTDSFDVRFGGAEANVAVGLASLSEKVKYVTKLPDNPIGDAAVSALRKYGVNTDNVVRGGSRIGIYYLEKGASQRSSKVIYDRAGSSMAEATEEDFDFTSIFKDAGWFHITGITPAISERAAGICAKALLTAQRLGVTVSMDLNYRKKLWDVQTASDTMNSLLPGVDVVIANEEHASKICSVRCDDDLAETAKLLCEKYGLSAAMVTRRRTFSADMNRICSAAYIDREKVYSPSYDCNIVDRVGGGDAFAAGFIYALIHNRSPQEAVDFAAAASALKHSIEGDFNTASIQEIEAAAAGATGKTER